MMGVQRMDEWELNYLLNLLDDDGNRSIDVDELIHNYLFLAQYLVKNQAMVEKNDSSLNLLDELTKCCKLKDKEYFIENL